MCVVVIAYVVAGEIIVLYKYVKYFSGKTSVEFVVIVYLWVLG